MIIDKNFKEILNLAFQKDPILAEIYVTKMVIKMPSHFILVGQRGRNEYELDEPDEYIPNEEKIKLEDLISELRLKYTAK